jgi:hypothetical protein
MQGILQEKVKGKRSVGRRRIIADRHMKKKKKGNTYFVILKITLEI